MSYSCTNVDVAVKTEHDLAIGEILDKASDLHKSVIGAYTCVKLGMSLMLQLCQVPSLVPQPCQAVLFILVLRL